MSQLAYEARAITALADLRQALAEEMACWAIYRSAQSRSHPDSAATCRREVDAASARTAAAFETWVSAIREGKQ
jgi:hypothetical protein